MSTDAHPEPIRNQLSETAREIARRAAETAKENANRTAAAARKAASAIGDTAGDTLTTSQEYVRRNPVPVVLGAIAFGAAIGYLLMTARRKPTIGERCAGEPMVAVREAILAAFAPVAQRVHGGYDSVRDGAGKVMDSAPGRNGRSLAHQIGRIGNNLKFW